MTTDISIPVDEAVRVFRFLEAANAFMHQPMQLDNPSACIEFINHHYAEVKELYYHTVWNWLPRQTQVDIENG